MPEILFFEDVMPSPWRPTDIQEMGMLGGSGCEVVRWSDSGCWVTARVFASEQIGGPTITKIQVKVEKTGETFTLPQGFKGLEFFDE